MGESVPVFVWVVLPLLAAAGASIVTAMLLQARFDVAQAQEREKLAETRALVTAAQQMMHQRLEAAESKARREALEEVLGGIQTEQRRQGKHHRGPSVIEERVCFRGIPLTPWFVRSVAIARQLPAGLVPVAERARLIG